MEKRQVVIIGAGPAGIACAIQLKHCGITPLVIERKAVGGLLKNANLVENFPGYPMGIKGLELVKAFKTHYEKCRIETLFTEVIKASFQDNEFVIETPNGVLHSKFLVIASGTKPRKFDDCIIPDDLQHLVLYEVYPLNEAETRKIIIVGSGDAAFDYAINLSAKNEVVILNRNSETRCLEILYERALKLDNVTYHPETVIEQIFREGEGIILDAINPAGKMHYNADHLVIAIGREPNINFVASDLHKRIKNLDNDDRLYMIGDVKNGRYRQTAISIGDGVRAALEIYDKIRG